VLLAAALGGQGSSTSTSINDYLNRRRLTGTQAIWQLFSLFTTLRRQPIHR